MEGAGGETSPVVSAGADTPWADHYYAHKGANLRLILQFFVLCRELAHW
ncbi:hypothetical protein CCHOA_07935 [Corynebacterium choanae]|uniref:Uncharacterized protein n=1 Tax=Corynebacterium choanae TaxID=1862358 RepID=A0A3G6J7W1_9CORY|nr:hypothetical protein CCHOA_07935 [Corynebacterium choanae]